MYNDRIQEQADAISFRQLRLFESVGRMESVRRGSEECNLSQPAVTQAIRKLEEQLGEALFERRASGSYLNGAGEIFHKRVRSFIAQMENALLDLGVNGGREGCSAIANRISRSQVRSLIAIIENGHFPAAADKLGLSQASLQRAARDLESNIHKSIFHRTAAGVVVTPKGAEFGRRVKLAIQEIEWGIREIEVARGNSLGQIVIGALPFGGSMMLATVLDEFITAYPNADVRIVTEGASEMIRRLRAGDVDIVIGLVQETKADDLRNDILVQTPYRIVCHRNHPLASKSVVTKEQLLAYDWVVGTEGSSRRQCFDGLFSGSERPKAPIATSSLPIIRHLLASSNRLTLITDYELDYEGDPVVGLPFVGLPFEAIEPEPSIGVTLRRDWMPTRLHMDFVKLLHARVAGPMGVAAE